MINYAYIGDVSLLKTIGYEFQKLYASNYKSYKKDKIIMFVIEKMVLEINNIDFEDQVKIIDFILENKNQPKSFWVEDRILKTNPPMPYNDAPLFVMTRFGNIIKHSTFNKGKLDYINDFSKIMKLEKGSILKKKLNKEEIDKLYDDIEETEFALDPFRFRIDFINQIIELDNLHPLEKLELEIKG